MIETGWEMPSQRVAQEAVLAELRQEIGRLRAEVRELKDEINRLRHFDTETIAIG